MEGRPIYDMFQQIKNCSRPGEIEARNFQINILENKKNKISSWKKQDLKTGIGSRDNSLSFTDL